MPSALFSVLDPKAIAGMLDQRVPVGYKGLEIFKSIEEKRDNETVIEFDVISGRQRIAPFTGLKAPSLPMKMPGFKKIRATPVTVKVHNLLFEVDKMCMRRPGETLEVWGQRMNDVATDNLQKAVWTAEEWFIWEAFKGSIAYTSTLSNMQISINFGLATAHNETLTGARKWDAPTTADPIYDLDFAIATIMQDSGLQPEYIVMNMFTLLKAVKASALKTQFTYTANLIVDAVKAYYKTLYNCELVIYAGPYETEAGANANMIADGHVYIFAKGAMTPISAASEYNGNGEVYKAGYFAAIEEKTDPKTTKVIAGKNFIYALTNPNASFHYITY